MRTVYPIGTTMYQPDRCCNGVTIVWDWTTCDVGLIDMNGRRAHTWQIEADPDRPVDRARLMPNGNVLICEALNSRTFEATPEGETVWEHIGPANRAYRYAYDFCPQLAALGKPDQRPVTPSAELRIEPE